MKTAYYENESEIYKYEIHPAEYIKRRKSARRRSIEEAVGLILLVVMGVATFAFVQVSYGIW